MGLLFLLLRLAGLSDLDVLLELVKQRCELRFYLLVFLGQFREFQGDDFFLLQEIIELGCERLAAGFKVLAFGLLCLLFGLQFHESLLCHSRRCELVDQCPLCIEEFNLPLLLLVLSAPVERFFLCLAHHVLEFLADLLDELEFPTSALSVLSSLRSCDSFLSV